MIHANQRREGLSAAIFGLWRNWTIAVGFLAILAFVSPLVRVTWLAPICIVEFLLLQVVRTVITGQGVPTCSRLYKEISVTILFITLVVLARTIFSGEGSVELTGQPVNAKGSIIGILISAPVATVVTMFFLLQRSEPLVCQLCHLRYGSVIKNGLIGRLYRQEWYFQTRLLFLLSLLLTVVDWIYYMMRYVNVDLNNADMFFFMWLPLVLYISSLLYLGWRYYTLWVYYCQNDEGKIVEQPSSTTVRYLVLCEDRILIDFRPTDKSFSNGAVIKRFDTPAVVTLPYRERMDLANATELFRQSTGISGAEIKEMYSSPDNVTFRNIFHYFAFLENRDDIIDSRIQGEWITLGELRQLMLQHITGMELNSELERIYRIAMAWKTYDRDGNRLYQFKHYRPTFRLRDIRSWEVDYNDGHWLYVGKLNQDSPLFRIRRWMRRMEDKLRRQAIRINLFA